MKCAESLGSSIGKISLAALALLILLAYLLTKLFLLARAGNNNSMS